MKFARVGMSKIKTHRGQQHPVDSCSSIHHLVVSMVAMPMITQDGMCNVVQMPPNLMPSPCQRHNLQQGISTFFEPAHWPRGLVAIEDIVTGHCFLRRVVVRASWIEFLPELFTKGLVNDSCFGREASNKRLVILLRLQVQDAAPLHRNPAMQSPHRFHLLFWDCRNQ